MLLINLNVFGDAKLLFVVINIKIFTMRGDALSHQLSVQLLWWIHPIRKLQHNNIVPRPYT